MSSGGVHPGVDAAADDRGGRRVCVGIDAGSRAIKAVAVDAESGEVLSAVIADQGVAQGELADRLYRAALAEAGARVGDVARCVATGYARSAVAAADTTVTEITCHARGVHRLRNGDVATIVEIGGQDSKLIRLGPGGAVRDFEMNDRCAAGTGRFLEIVADRLEVDLVDLGALAQRSETPALISSMCVVFAETEIIGLLSSGASECDIAAGVQSSLAARVAGLAGGRVEAPAVFTGGVARLEAMAGAIEDALGVDVSVPDRPEMTGALGAALLAAEEAVRPIG